MLNIFIFPNVFHNFAFKVENIVYIFKEICYMSDICAYLYPTMGNSIGKHCIDN